MDSMPKRLRDYGIVIGAQATGRLNAITDVAGVRVGHKTIVEGNDIRTGVTVIVPGEGNVFQQKLAAGVYVGNGFGKMTGISQIQELGNLETPIVLTNTLAVAAGVEALVRYTMRQDGNELVRSCNAVVGETNDGELNDIRAMRVTAGDVMEAIDCAAGGVVTEGCVGAGTGTVCFGFKGGIGTASRVAECGGAGRYTVGALVQTNFGGRLTIDGRAYGPGGTQDVDGSCMMVVATDAPLCARNLSRLAKRAFLGLGRTGGYASNGSGDFVIAFSTAEQTRVPQEGRGELLLRRELHNNDVTPLFQGAIESTEEAILNSLVAAVDMTGHGGKTVRAVRM